MALQYVGGNTGTWVGSTGTTNSISLTALTGGIASSAQAGDLVIAVYVTGSAANRALSITDPSSTSYTLIDAELYSDGTTYDTNLEVAYKRLTAADATTRFGPTNSTADAGAAVVHVWRGVHATTPLDVAAVAATGTGTGRPNAASITPTTSGAIVLVAGGGAAATGAVFTATELSNFRTATSADNNDAMVGLGSFAWSSGAFDPAQWTGGTTNAADSWAAMTIALRPAATATLTPSLYTNSQTFYSATVGSTYFLAPALYTNAQTFHAVSVTTSTPLVAALYANSQTFYSPSVTQPAVGQDLQPSLYGNSQAFYAAAVTTSYVLDVARYDNGQTNFAPTVATSYSLLPSVFDNAQTFQAASLLSSYGLFAGLYNNGAQVYEPTAFSSYWLTPNGYSNAQAFYGAAVSQTGDVPTLLPQLVNNSQAFYAPEVALEGGAGGDANHEVEIIDFEPKLWWLRRPKAVPEYVAKEKVKKVARTIQKVVREKADAKQEPTKKEVKQAVASLVQEMPGFDWVALYQHILIQINLNRLDEQRVREAMERQARIEFEQDEEDALILLMAA